MALDLGCLINHGVEYGETMYLSCLDGKALEFKWFGWRIRHPAVVSEKLWLAVDQLQLAIRSQKGHRECPMVAFPKTCKIRILHYGHLTVGHIVHPRRAVRLT